MAEPLINGTEYSWVDLKFIIGGAMVYGVKAINHTIKQDKVNNYGAGENPVSRGKGAKTFEGSITFQKREIEKLRALVPNGDITSLGAFTIEISAVIEGDTSSGIAYALNNCEFMEDVSDGSQGDTELISVIPFIFAGQQKIG